MADDDKLPQAIQESIVTAIAFVSDDNSTVIANLADPETFDPPYDDIAYRCLEHRRKYKRAPGREHLDDVFSHILDGDKNKPQYREYYRLLHGMSAIADKLDTEFVLDHLSDFTQLRRLRAGISRAAERYQKGGNNFAETSEDLKSIFRDCIRIQTRQRDYGFSMSDDTALGFLEKEEHDYCQLNIPEVDRVGCIPTKQELLVFVAARNRGKSFFAHHCGKYALIKGWTIFHYTLENSPEMSAQRYYQMLFSGVRHATDPKSKDGKYHYTPLKNDNGGLVSELREQVVPTNFVIDQRDRTASYLKRRVKEEGYRMQNLRIRRFPTGKLSFSQLEQDLDEIELIHKQRPDLLIIDSPQLMKYDRRHQFEMLGELYINLRGLAVERDLAVVATHQGNRRSESASTVYGSQIAGSIDIIGIADNVITYSQTASEESKGLARLYLQKVRNDTARDIVLISQHYPSGQFCMDSHFMSKNISDMVSAYTGTKRVDDDIEVEDDEHEAEVLVKRGVK